MNEGNVAAFACGRLHPQLGDQAPCMRQRHHAGDHRTTHEDQLKVWADPATPYDVPTVRTLIDQDGDPLPVDAFGKYPGRVLSDPVPGELDEQAETWLEGRVAPEWSLYVFGFALGITLALINAALFKYVFS